MSGSMKSAAVAGSSLDRRRCSETAFSPDGDASLSRPLRSTTPNGSRRAFALSCAHVNSSSDRTLSPVSWRHNPYGVQHSSPPVEYRSPTSQLPGGPCVTVSTRASGTGHWMSMHGVVASSRSTPSLSRTDMDEWRPLSPVHSVVQETQSSQQMQSFSPTQQGAQDVRPWHSVSHTGRYWPGARSLTSLSASSSVMPNVAEATPTRRVCRSPPNAVLPSFSIRSSQSSFSVPSGKDGLIGSFMNPASVSMSSSPQVVTAGNCVPATPKEAPPKEKADSQSMFHHRYPPQAGVEKTGAHEMNSSPRRLLALHSHMDCANLLVLPPVKAVRDNSSQRSAEDGEEDQMRYENDNNDMEEHCATLRPDDVRMQLGVFRLCENTSGEESLPATVSGSFPFHHANNATGVFRQSESRESHVNPLHGWGASESEGEVHLSSAPPQEVLCMTEASIEPSTLPPSPLLQSPPSPFTVDMTVMAREMATENSSSPPLTSQSALLNTPPTVKAAQLEQIILSRPKEEVACPGGFYFSVYGATLQQHYVIESSKIFVTRGAVRYLALYELHGAQFRFRFQLCKRFLQKHCTKGAHCQYIHTSDVPSPTWVHINENIVNPLSKDLNDPTAQDHRGGKNAHKYTTLPAGVDFRVYPPNKTKSSPQIVPSDKILYTLGSTNVYSVLVKGSKNASKPNRTDDVHRDGRENLSSETAGDESTAGDGVKDATGQSLYANNLKPRHCAHFQFSKMCNLGSNCNFIHSLVPYVQPVSESLPAHASPDAALFPASWAVELSAQRQIIPQAHMHTSCDSGLHMVHVPMHSYSGAIEQQQRQQQQQQQQRQQQQYFSSAISCGLPQQSFQFASPLQSLGGKPFAAALPAFGTIPHGY